MKENRSLYGLKQSQRCWNLTLDGVLKELGFHQFKSDPCVYVVAEEELVVVDVYVDDIMMAYKRENWMNGVQEGYLRVV